MGKIHGNGNSPSATDLSPRSGAQKRPRSQLSNSSGGGAGAGPGIGGLVGHGGAAAAAAVNLSESLYGYAASPHQSSRFSQVGSGTSKKNKVKVMKESHILAASGESEMTADSSSS